ncbi:MAG: anti-sigma F factor [Christensenellales bacterium]
MNKFSMQISALSSNEGFVRSTVSAFCAHLNPTIEQLDEIKTAVSEAFTNCVVHAYSPDENQTITVEVCLENDVASILIQDRGKGIEDVEKAMQPFYTTRPEQERSGMGFTLMNTFMDSVKVTSQLGGGTQVLMTKSLKEEK